MTSLVCIKVFLLLLEIAKLIQIHYVNCKENMFLIRLIR